METKAFVQRLFNEFPYPPTESQKNLIVSLSRFILETADRKLFVLKGYAGTGKTTVVSTIVKNLHFVQKESVLLAPTGRAAKVLSAYSGARAFTIHKHIYFLSTGIDGGVRMMLGFNKHKNTIFMVDEASMIPDNSVSTDSGLFSSRNLLDDLINYVYSGKNCKLILIGDTAQLPPVGADESPALHLEFLKNSFHLEVGSYELTEVVRQSLESGILANATGIRKNIETESSSLSINVKDYPDVIRINGIELEDFLNDAFSRSGNEETVVITRSNKRANIFNQEIRKRILFLEDEISTGDYLMIVRNNYFWIDKGSRTGFLANGDIIEIMRILKYEELYGFRFADITIRLTDYPDEKDLTVKILLDTLSIDGPALSSSGSNRLFEEVMKDYEEIPSRRGRIEKVKNNPYFNALQVKFAYALTCHKTQGGQWERVFIDQGIIREDQVNKEYFRWLYTAFTRATKVLYLVNFNDRFFG
jgi:exodeoxyribonuclease-5